MRCPGCGAPPGPIPTATVGNLETRLGPGDTWWDADTWWCRPCLTASLIAAHDDHCRCEDCRPAPRSAA